MGIYKGAALCGIYVQWFALCLSVCVCVCEIYTYMHVCICVRARAHIHIFIHVCIYELSTFNLISFLYFSVIMFSRLIPVMLYLLVTNRSSIRTILVSVTKIKHFDLFYLPCRSSCLRHTLTS
jgi:hypothetical protein